MPENRHTDSPFPHHWVQPLNNKPDCILKNIPEHQEQNVYINSSNGYLDKRTTRLSVEVSRLQRKVTSLTNVVKLLALKLDISEEEIEKYL